MRNWLPVIILALFSLPVTAQGNFDNCRAAAEDDVPLGGNEIIIYNTGKLKRVQGIVTYTSERLSEDVVVEVFEVTDKEKADINQNAWKIAESKTRKIACVTGKAGKFRFQNLPDGIYVLRIGTRTRDLEYFNHVFVIVELDAENGKNKKIKAVLQVAT